MAQLNIINNSSKCMLVYLTDCTIKLFKNRHVKF